MLDILSAALISQFSANHRRTPDMHTEQEQAGDVLHPENNPAHNGINNLIFKSHHPGEDFRVPD